ncbi:MAG: phosphatidate cytidylyltransferase [Acidimicrobiia bacterium]
MSDDRPRFRRPWEEPLDGDAADRESEGEAPSDVPAEDQAVTPPEAVDRPEGPEPAGESDEEPPSGTPDADLADWEAMSDAPTSLDDFSSETYAAATTEEYRGLAEEISRLKETTFERQAVSATIAGVDTGLVGFEDVTGRRGVTEEDVEAQEQARSSDLALRVGTALGLVALLVGSLYLGGWWFTSFLALLMIISLGEFYATLRKVGYSPLALVGLLGVLVTPLLVQSSGLFSMAGVLVTAAVVVVLVYSILPRRAPLDNAAVTVFGMQWVALLAFAVPIASGPHPVAYVMLIGIVTALVDVGSYFIGRGFGRRLLAPRLSPNKTVEGFLGGLVAGVAVGAVLSTFPPYADLGFRGVVALSVLMALVGPLGDLAESMVKRSLGVKDMGSVLPGHGGMLDRIDSFLFTVPAAYVFLFVVGIL